jgi:Secretion system C-terminal sorting domain
MTNRILLTLLIAFSYFTVSSICGQTITSAQNGLWSATSTWVGGVIPSATSDVIIAHNVTITGTNAICKNMTVKASDTLQMNYSLNIKGNLTIDSLGVFTNSSSFGGTKIETTANSPSTQLVTVNGTLNTLIDYSIIPKFAISGRMVFNPGSTLNMDGKILFNGWSGSTPEYLLNVDNVTNLNIGGSAEFSFQGHTSSTLPAISPNRNLEGPLFFYTGGCPLGVYKLIGLGNINSNFYFGSSSSTTRQRLGSVTNDIATTTPRNIYLNNLYVYTLLPNFSNYSTNANLYATNVRFEGGNLKGTNLFGDLTLTNNCGGSSATFAIDSTFIIKSTANLTLNTTDSSIILVSSNTLPIGGNITIQSGKVIIKNHTLDLSNTNITGLNSSNYFITKEGGAVILPAVSSGVSTSFNLGIGIPNGSNPPIAAYAPLNIVSDANSNVSVSLQPLVAPSGFVAPQIQWNITPTGNPSLTLTFNWSASAETPAFAALRNTAKVYHWNGTIWEQLNSGMVTGPDAGGLYSLTVTGVTQFSPFAVMASSPLSAELIQFSAKANNSKVTLNWQTASETNVKNFDIEKSLDGKNFIKIKEVKANNTPSVYQAFDDNFTESAYYRLKTNDLDGKTDYSKTVFVAYNKKQKLQIFPNPVKDKITILGASKDDFKITDLLGRVILRGPLSDNQTEVDVSALPSGLYLLQIKEAVEKFLKE